MITKKSNQTSKLRVCPIFGDLGMIVQLIRSNIIKQIYQGDKKVWWTIFLWMIKAKIEMLALLSRSIFRYNHGRHTTGILMSVWTLSMLIAFNNNQGVIGYLIGSIPFGAPVLLINMTWSQFEGIVWYQTSSSALVYWAGIFILFQVVHVFRIYLEVGNTDDHMKRGSSWLWTWIFKKTKVTEFHIQCYVEPIIIASTGYMHWWIWSDIHFLIIALSSALCLFLQEFLDGSYRYFHSRF